MVHDTFLLTRSEGVLWILQAQMARELQLDRELVFTVRRDAPLRLTRGQVGGIGGFGKNPRCRSFCSLPSLDWLPEIRALLMQSSSPARSVHSCKRMTENDADFVTPLCTTCACGDFQVVARISILVLQKLIHILHMFHQMMPQMRSTANCGSTSLRSLAPETDHV